MATDREQLAGTQDRARHTPDQSSPQDGGTGLGHTCEHAGQRPRAEVPPAPDDDTDPTAATAYLSTTATALSAAADKLAATAERADSRAGAALRKAASAWQKLLAAARTTDDDTAAGEPDEQLGWPRMH